MPIFTPEKFEAMIARRGRPVRWERAARCPCLDPLRFAPTENCPDCGSIGYRYTTIETFTATVLSITGNSKYAKFGEIMAGDSVMTYPAAKLIGDKDRFTLTTGLDRNSDLLIRGTRDMLIDTEIVSIVEVRDANTVFAPEDYELVGQEIVWVGQRPADGAPYSVLYTARPQYIVWLEIPQQRIKVPRVLPDGTPTEKEMPRKVMLRRWVDWVRPANAA